MAEVRRGFVTHRKVRCGNCGAEQVIPALIAGKVPCAACGTPVRVSKGADVLRPA